MEPRWIEQLPPLPGRPDDGHKGTFGTVVVVGGSGRMIGAPALTATAALRSGAGLVKVAAEVDVARAVTSIQPSVTGLAAAGLAELRGLPRVVLAVGPGWGSGDDVDARLADLGVWPNPIVLDADGLNALARLSVGAVSGGGPRVLTPHPGEYGRLAEAFGLDGDPVDPQRRPAAAAALAEAAGAVVLLKGRHTVVTDGRRFYRNATGNPALATAGTGDVLTGLIAGLIAQGTDPFDAAVAGAWVHGRAGDRWAEAHGRRGLLATELADRLPAVLREYETTAAAE
ncbi:MAG: NAD(P)H-hydrate dehydratase [Planctomycetota bacterium]